MRRILALAVVGFVLGLGAAAGAEGDSVTVGISNQAYTPVIATIHSGGTVTWVNDDEETHSVFIEAIGSDHLVAPGATYSYTFGDAGEFTYHCSLHNHAGKIVVAAVVATTQPPPPKPVTTTVPTTLPATTTATTVATMVPTTAGPTTAPPVTTAAATTTTVTVPTTPAVTDSTTAPVGAIDDGAGGGLPSAALIGGGGVGAALGVGAGFLIQRRVGRRAADGA
ncbi:MAG: cupredoxin domain-containing protein [Acidimicrobiales bacterium]